jgi:hypothetical protein
MRNPIGESFLYGQFRDNDHISVLTTRAAKKIDAGEFEYKITGQGFRTQFCSRPNIQYAPFSPQSKIVMIVVMPNPRTIA